MSYDKRIKKSAARRLLDFVHKSDGVTRIRIRIKSNWASDDSKTNSKKMGAREDEYDYLFKGNYKHDTAGGRRSVEVVVKVGRSSDGPPLSLSSAWTQWRSGSMALIETNWRITESAVKSPEFMCWYVCECECVINSQNKSKKYAPRVCCCCCFPCSWMPFGGSLALPLSLWGLSSGFKYIAVNCLFCHYVPVALATLHAKSKANRIHIRDKSCQFQRGVVLNASQALAFLSWLDFQLESRARV